MVTVVTLVMTAILVLLTNFVDPPMSLVLVTSPTNSVQGWQKNYLLEMEVREE
jgi:hypothetical protein